MIYTFFYADGRVERRPTEPHEFVSVIDFLSCDTELFDLEKPGAIAANVIQRIFRLHSFDRHWRIVDSKARWEVYVEDGHQAAVLAGANAAQALGQFAERLQW